VFGGEGGRGLGCGHVGGGVLRGIGLVFCEFGFIEPLGVSYALVLSKVDGIVWMGKVQ
jgi:hypothetical protein